MERKITPFIIGIILIAVAVFAARLPYTIQIKPPYHEMLQFACTTFFLGVFMLFINLVIHWIRGKQTKRRDA